MENSKSQGGPKRAAPVTRAIQAASNARVEHKTKYPANDANVGGQAIGAVEYWARQRTGPHCLHQRDQQPQVALNRAFSRAFLLRDQPKYGTSLDTCRFANFAYAPIRPVFIHDSLPALRLLLTLQLTLLNPGVLSLLHGS